MAQPIPHPENSSNSSKGKPLRYMPICVSDWIMATRHLDYGERGLLLDLRILIWTMPGYSIPDDDAWIAKRMMLASDIVAQKLRPLIEEFCQVKAGRITDPVVQATADIVSSFSEKQRGRVNSRWQNTNSLKNKENDSYRGNTGTIPNESESESESLKKESARARARDSLDSDRTQIRPYDIVDDLNQVIFTQSEIEELAPRHPALKNFRDEAKHSVAWAIEEGIASHRRRAACRNFLWNRNTKQAAFQEERAAKAKERKEEAHRREQIRLAQQSERVEWEKPY